VPSQNGFFVDAPQRQSTVLVWVAKIFPFVSRSSIGPLTMYGPFGLASIVTSAMGDFLSFSNVKSLTRLPTGDWSGQEPAPDRYGRYQVTGGVTQRPPGNLPLIGGGTHRSRTLLLTTNTPEA
jgi:hypothetical protein